jgi:hypothetical protein
VADGVDAAVHSVEPAALDAASYSSAPQPEVVELSAGNHAMLAAGQTRDRPFPGDNVNRCIYLMHDCDLDRHGTRMTAAGAPQGYERYGIETERRRAENSRRTYGAMATIRSIGSRARSASSGSTLTV